MDVDQWWQGDVNEDKGGKVTGRWPRKEGDFLPENFLPENFLPVCKFQKTISTKCLFCWQNTVVARWCQWRQRRQGDRPVTQEGRWLPSWKLPSRLQIPENNVHQMPFLLTEHCGGKVMSMKTKEARWQACDPGRKVTSFLKNPT
jgi:hypothetical protein